MRVRFTVKKPGGLRRSFAIMKDVIFDPGDTSAPKDLKTGKRKTRVQEVHSCNEIDALNQRFLAEDIDEAEALRQIKKVIIPRLKNESGVRARAIDESRFCEDNYRLFVKFYEKEYEENDDKVREDATLENAQIELKKAIIMIEPLPLTTVDKRTLKKHWKDHVEENDLTITAQRRYGTRINQLLRFAGRDFILVLPRKDSIEDIHHLTKDEFDHGLIPAIQKYNDREAELLAKVLFGGGLRYGEAFVFNDPSEIQNNRTVHVARQMDRKLKIRALKNKKKHNTIILPDYVDAFKEWCALPDKKALRVRLHKKIWEYAKVAFPNTPKKQISNHDLRHSFAIYLLGEMGLSISDVAMLIGDEEATVRAHYTGNKVLDPQAKRINAVIDMITAKHKAEKKLLRTKK